MIASALHIKASKSFAGKQVLFDVDVNVRAGSIHALVGENGAGKSTLVKIAAGLIGADATMSRDGIELPMQNFSVAKARAAGIGIVQQHGSFASGLTVAENASVGYEVTRNGRLDIEAMASRLQQCGQQWGLAIDPHAKVSQLSVGQALRAELVTVLMRQARVVLLDEPTAVLTPPEVDELFVVLRALANKGTAIVLVTHRLREIQAVADDVTVLRHGRNAGHFTMESSAIDAIAQAMIGTATQSQQNHRKRYAPSDRANAANVRQLRCDGINIDELTVAAGEIVGIAGIEGQGQAALCQAISGERNATGVVEIAGRNCQRLTIAQRRQLGLGYIPDDRLQAGLWLGGTVAQNLALGRDDITGRFWLRRAAIQTFATQQIAQFDIRPHDANTLVAQLSGGNQQKILVARELTRPKLRLLVAAQPTRGVDFAASLAIWKHIHDVAAQGVGVLVVSADLDELLSNADRIAVLRGGQLVGSVTTSDGNGDDARSKLGNWMVKN
jgi:general nucleoside transport system ATP-binding protein